jgi:hypothetical protein
MLLSWCLWDTLVVWVHSTSETTKQNDPPICMELITESISKRVEVEHLNSRSSAWYVSNTKLKQGKEVDSTRCHRRACC